MFSNIFAHILGITIVEFITELTMFEIGGFSWWYLYFGWQLHSKSMEFSSLDCSTTNIIDLYKECSEFQWFHPGPARPLGELVDRLGRQPLRGAKNATEKEKGTEKWKITCHTPQDPSDWGGEGLANAGFA